MEEHTSAKLGKNTFKIGQAGNGGVKMEQNAFELKQGFHKYERSTSRSCGRLLSRLGDGEARIRSLCKSTFELGQTNHICGAVGEYEE